MKKTIILLLVAGILLGSRLTYASEADQETVRAVQEILNQSGFDCGTPDGLFGSKTEGAIRQYQEANGLSVDGAISEELMSAMGLITSPEQLQDEEVIPAVVEIDNEQAWNELHLFLSENGADVNGMKGIQRIGEDRTTSIGIIEGDSDNIYLATKADFELLSTSLTFALKKNDRNVEFRFDDMMDSKEPQIYSHAHAYGHVDISTITSQTLLSPEVYDREVKDLNGNVTSSSDMSSFFPDSSPKQSLYQLLTDLPDVLSAAGLDLTMNDLGFYVNLDKVYGIELGKGETVFNLVNDVYMVIPDDWTVVDAGGGSIYMYPPENTDQIKDHILNILCSPITNTGGLGAFSRGEEREAYLKGTFDTFRKDNFTMTNEEAGIEIGGFQGRRAQIVWTESIGDSDLDLASFLVDGYKLEDYVVMIGYKVHRTIETKHADVYQRVLDTIYVDTDGSYTASLTGGN